jgi:hypothetical protein
MMLLTNDNFIAYLEIIVGFFQFPTQTYALNMPEEK